MWKKFYQQTLLHLKIALQKNKRPADWPTDLRSTDEFTAIYISSYEVRSLRK